MRENSRQEWFNTVNCFRSVKMNEAEKLKFLTKEQDVPTELIKELSSDGGVEGIKAALVEQGWNKQDPIGVMMHSLDEAGNIGSSRWLLLVSFILS